MRIFLDTNVLVSAFASRGLCADLFELVLLDHDLVLGEHVINELGRALRRKLRLPEPIAEEIVAFVSGEASQVVSKSQPLDAKVDRGDALVLGQALSARADVIVTGDAALLKLGAVQGTKIVSPRGLWDMLRT